MKTLHTFEKYRSIIGKYSPDDFGEDAQSKKEFLIAESENNKMRTYYAPFEHINQDAKLILVGITPGRTQMNNALRAACEAIHDGKSDKQSLFEAKKSASFSGSMRKVLIQMLDQYGFNQKLGLKSCAELWGSQNHLVHFTSALLNPVFCCNGETENNYTGGSPNLASFKGFKNTLKDLKAELLAIENAFVLPLGDKVAKAIQLLVNDGSIPLKKVLNAEGRVAELPHPSGANGESHALVLQENSATMEEYSNKKLSDYMRNQAMKGGSVSSNKQLRYLGVRKSYWQRALHTRIALSSINE